MATCAVQSQQAQDVGSTLFQPQVLTLIQHWKLIENEIGINVEIRHWINVRLSTLILISFSTRFQPVFNVRFQPDFDQLSTLFQRETNHISTKFQRDFNEISTRFQHACRFYFHEINTMQDVVYPLTYWLKYTGLVFNMEYWHNSHVKVYFYLMCCFWELRGGHLFPMQQNSCKIHTSKLETPKNPNASTLQIFSPEIPFLSLSKNFQWLK